MRAIGALLIILVLPAAPAAAEPADLGSGWHLRGRIGPASAMPASLPAEGARAQSQWSFGAAGAVWAATFPNRADWSAASGASLGTLFVHSREDVRLFAGAFLALDTAVGDPGGLDPADPAYVTRLWRRTAARAWHRSEASASGLAMFAGMSFDLAPHRTFSLGYRYLNLLGVPGETGRIGPAALGRGRGDAHELRAGLSYVFR